MSKTVIVLLACIMLGARVAEAVTCGAQVTPAGGAATDVDCGNDKYCNTPADTSGDATVAGAVAARCKACNAAGASVAALSNCAECTQAGAGGATTKTIAATSISCAKCTTGYSRKSDGTCALDCTADTGCAAAEACNALGTTLYNKQCLTCSSGANTFGAATTGTFPYAGATAGITDCATCTYASSSTANTIFCKSCTTTATNSPLEDGSACSAHCTTDAICSGTAVKACNLDGTAGTLRRCFSCNKAGYGATGTGVAYPGCSTCTYQSTATANSFKCTGASANYFILTGTGAPGGAYSKSAPAEGGHYSCATLATSFTGYDKVSCTALTAGTTGSSGTDAALATAGLWLNIDNVASPNHARTETKTCHETKAGCKSCTAGAAAATLAAQTLTCNAVFSGFVLPATVDATTVPTECTNPWCTTCAQATPGTCTAVKSSVSADVFLDTTAGTIKHKLSQDSAAASLTAATTVTCISGWTLNKEGTGCVGCRWADQNAATCTYDAEKKTVTLLTCDSGYVLSTDKTKCINCGDFTTTCTIDTKDVITAVTCATTAYKTAADSKTCITCGTGAASCATPSAALATVVCMSGYFGPGTGTSCTKCPAASTTCTSATAHTTCANGNYAPATGTVCVSGATKIANCKVFSATSVGTGSDSPTCTTCETGYYSFDSSKTCIKVGDGATSAVAWRATVTATAVSSVKYWHQGCDSGYFLNAGVCTACPSGASACEGNGWSASVWATSCKAGFYLGADGTCKACSGNAASCHVYAGKDYVKTCADTHDLVKGMWPNWHSCKAKPAAAAAATTNSVYMVASYFAMIALLFVALF